MKELRRKLTAILSADVKGYSRLMGEDEVGTIRTLNAYKGMMSNLIQQHHGRVVDAPGDNVLAEFGSVVDAVECAVEIQKDLKTRNAEVPENRRMEFRIGVNLGDVVEEGERIFGDGVNIAARIESLAEAGGVCISGTAFDQVRNKLNLGYEYLGEQTVKNIAVPVRVYRVLMEPEAAGKVIVERKAKPTQWQRVAIGLVVVVVIAAIVIWKLSTPPAPQPEKVPTVVPPSVEVAPKEKVTPPQTEKVVKPKAPPAPKVEVASKEKMAFPLPDKPSIAVLPFVNMTGDPRQEFFCDGMTEEIITALSKSQYLFVIARTSTFTYKDKPVKVKQVSEELGVRYVLEGSVRREGNRMRITAQLIDALTGSHLWAERYDRDLKDIFALQDEITMKILTELQVKLTEGETSRIHAKGTYNLQAYLKLLEGNVYRYQNNKEANAVAKRLYQEALALDPNYTMAYICLARAHGLDVWLGASESPKETLSNAMKLAQKAIELDNSSAEAHATLSFIFLAMRQHDKAIEVGERAVALDPDNAMAVFTLGISLNYSWRSEEALPLLRQALRLNPFVPNYYHHFSLSCREIGRYEEGIAALKKSLQLAPNDVLAYMILTSLYMYAGREEEARASAAEVLRINPNFSVERFFARGTPWKEGPRRDRYMEALRQAGLK